MNAPTTTATEVTPEAGAELPDNAPAELATINDIDRRTKLYAQAREDLAGLVTALNDGILALQRNAMPAIKRAVARASEHHAKLNALLLQRPDLFVRPRTTILHGVKIGYQKSKDSLAYDAESLLKQIKLRLPLKQAALIRTKEELILEGIKQLTPEEKAKVGIRDVAGKDQILIAPTDSAIDKAVTALLKAAVGDALDEAEATQAEG